MIFLIPGIKQYKIIMCNLRGKIMVLSYLIAFTFTLYADKLYYELQL